MKIQELNTKPDVDGQPCEMVTRYKMHVNGGGTLRTFINQFDFGSLPELEEGVKLICRTMVFDPFMADNKRRSNDIVLDLIYRQFYKVMTDASRSYIFPRTLAEELWNGGYSRKRLDEKMAEMLRIQPDPVKFAEYEAIIKTEYGLSDSDMEKLHFFVEQCKAMADFPNSHRRMLYIWGKAKKTGKTTAASCIVEILNGDLESYHNASGYTTKLADEMQIGEFKVPLRSQNNVCLMDECFYRDMGKTYADFKQMLTSSGGTARRPYGQPFQWEGWPNYVATSNDPLRNFITDWDDRRYLSIEFNTKPKVAVTDFDTIKGIWAQYIVNSQRTKEWYEWAEEIAPIADEGGERTERMEEFAAELMQPVFLARIRDRAGGVFSERVYLKYFVDFFAESIGNMEAHKRREEIEAAVIQVFGPRYSTTKYWKLSAIKDKADHLDCINKGIIDNDTANGHDAADDDLDF